MMPLQFLKEILAALEVHEKVTIKHRRPKQLWRLLKAELRMCDVTFDDDAVYVTWAQTDESEKLIPGKYETVVLAEGRIK